MFADAYYESSEIFVYKYVLNFHNGETQHLGRSFAGGFGSTEWNISKLIKINDLNTLKNILRTWVNRQTFNTPVDAITIFKLSATIPSKRNGAFVTKEKLVLKIPISELK